MSSYHEKRGGKWSLWIIPELWIGTRSGHDSYTYGMRGLRAPPPYLRTRDYVRAIQSHRVVFNGWCRFIPQVPAKKAGWGRLMHAGKRISSGMNARDNIPGLKCIELTDRRRYAHIYLGKKHTLYDSLLVSVRGTLLIGIGKYEYERRRRIWFTSIWCVSRKSGARNIGNVIRIEA